MQDASIYLLGLFVCFVIKQSHGLIESSSFRITVSSATIILDFEHAAVEHEHLLIWYKVRNILTRLEPANELQYFCAVGQCCLLVPRYLNSRSRSPDEVNKGLTMT